MAQGRFGWWQFRAMREMQDVWPSAGARHARVASIRTVHQCVDRGRAVRYQPTKGKRLSGKMSYRQRDEWGVNQVYNFGFGLSWNSQLRPWVSFDTSLWPAYTYATVHYPGGSTFEVAFSGESAFTNYINNTRVTVLTNSIANITGLRVSYPGGATEIYDFGLTDWNTNLYNAFLTSRTDRNGSFQRYIYDSDELTNSIVRLLYIVDPGGGRTP